MTEPSLGLIAEWIQQVHSRPQHACGIFLDAHDGQPFGPRARPWDEPDLLISATLRGGALDLRFDRYGAVFQVTLGAISAVTHTEHPWGAGLQVTGDCDGASTTVWLI